MLQRAISLLREGSKISSCVTLGSANTSDDPRLLHIPGGVFLVFSNDHVRRRPMQGYQDAGMCSRHVLEAGVVLCCPLQA